MKKLIPIIAICMATVCSFAAETYKFPGWKSTNIANLDKQIEILTNLPTHSLQHFKNLAIMMTIKDFAQNGVPATFEAYKAVYDKNVGLAAEKISDKKELWIELTKNNLCQLALCRKEFLKEAFEFTLATDPSKNEDYIIHYYCTEDVPMEPTVRYQKLIDLMLNNTTLQTTQYTKVGKYLNMVIKISIPAGIDNATMKKDFQNLNRVYSIKLIENKAKYEPIVAKIRTILETL